MLEIRIGEVDVQVNRRVIPQGLEHHIHPTLQLRHADTALVRDLQEQQSREQMIQVDGGVTVHRVHVPPGHLPGPTALALPVQDAQRSRRTGARGAGRQERSRSRLRCQRAGDPGTMPRVSSGWLSAALPSGAPRRMSMSTP